ncbi:GRAM domain-containing protein [Vallitalea okinawensis]|uniref:GRAM domain-containing protein n=1 Tax=Vallitalea okinawensis TaxID=2078660 RepID=UPI0013004B9E|nr:GRAM domain-containing protein [Vallitalea okinawensis]
MAIKPLLQGDLYYSIVVVLITGTMFGGSMFLITLFLTRKFKEKEKSICDVQKILISGGANHFIGKESVGGWLILTEDRLIFESHKANIQCHTLTVPIKDIIEIKPKRTLKLIPNGFTIATRDTDIHQFVVNNRDTWIRFLEEQAKSV